jgi:hypothetical protein
MDEIAYFAFWFRLKINSFVIPGVVRYADDVTPVQSQVTAREGRGGGRGRRL